MRAYPLTETPVELEEAELLAPSLIHEMRQPLTAVRAGLELVARRLGAEVTSLDDWAMIGAQLDRLEELFRAYQDFLHPERSVPAPFSPEPVLARAMHLLNHRLRRLGPRFAWIRPEHSCQALGVPNALLHATTNVLANALDAIGHDAQGRLEMRLLAPPGATHVELRISDSGPGIPSELRERIFEPRFTTKASGTGLGLHIARRMLTRSGGSILLAPEDDPLRADWARTELVLSLPCAPGRGAR